MTSRIHTFDISYSPEKRNLVLVPLGGLAAVYIAYPTALLAIVTVSYSQASISSKHLIYMQVQILDATYRHSECMFVPHVFLALGLGCKGAHQLGGQLGQGRQE